MPKKLLITLVFLPLWFGLVPIPRVTPVVFAQGANSCPVLVESALTATETVCGSTERNQACYGNVLNELVPRSELTSIQYNEVGDRAALAEILSLRMSVLDVATGHWGVTMMKVQANLPDTLPGQNVTFLLFGDVSIQDAAEPLVTQDMTANTGVNIRFVPDSEARVLDSLASGMNIAATARHINRKGETWVRVRHAVDKITTGWMIADALDGDIAALPELTDAAPIFGPMQAFYFSTGIGRPACVEAPSDGILIQSPEGLGKVNLTSNGVQIQLGSTAFMQAVPGQTMDVYLLEGDVLLTANGVTQDLNPGMVSRIPLDAQGIANGAPSYPEPYNLDNLIGLDKALKVLPREISIPAPATPAPAATVQPQITPTPPGADLPPCAYRHDIQTTVTFENVDLARKNYRIFRLNEQCIEEQVGDLRGYGSNASFPSAGGVTWIVRDEGGNEKARISTTQSDPYHVEIRG